MIKQQKPYGNYVKKKNTRNLFFRSVVTHIYDKLTAMRIMKNHIFTLRYVYTYCRFAAQHYANGLAMIFGIQIAAKATILAAAMITKTITNLCTHIITHYHRIKNEF